ncbi:Ail/Lom family outer membrane beta-barrel protein [Budvicia diplopodorum]|uniref:Ail/Lom family outer membrane beta-barrel protein n=1 Tax=Budvicia diplopodorum TaxID=1119056 RepID=UPI001359E0BD|nr:Ail/Lom family outer membrane beta-barrel protein [Budvicia diplopodorum]
MNKVLVAAAVFAALTAGNIAHAGNHTVTLGYAQSTVQDFDDIDGVNVKYRYEWDSPVSIISSFTYMSGNDDTSYLVTRDIINTHAEIKYYSLSVGPAYRFNDMVSIYGLLGVNLNKVDYSSSWLNYNGSGTYQNMGSINGSERKTSLMYGAGLQINAWEGVTVGVGYEGSQLDVDGQNHSINGFNVGLGYHF